MSDSITLEALDADGAIQETAEAAGATRADFLKRGGVAGAGFLAAACCSTASLARRGGDLDHTGRRRTTSRSSTTRSRSSTSRPSSTSRRSRPAPSPSAAVQDVRDHGGRARGDARRRRSRSSSARPAVKKPKFDFGDTVTNQDKFKATAQVLEDTGVAAYAGQGPNILQRPVVVAAPSRSTRSRRATRPGSASSTRRRPGGTATSSRRRRRRSTRR